MTTPDTSAVRAWARENGYDVADRGRLTAEVTDAYLAATGSANGRSAPTKKAVPVKKAAPAKKAVKKAAPAKKAAQGAKPVKVTTVAAAPAAPVDEPETVPTEVPAAEVPQPAPDPTTPRPRPSAVTDDRRLVALGEELAALTKRVEALESAAGSSRSGNKTPRFLRRS